MLLRFKIFSIFVFSLAAMLSIASENSQKSVVEGKLLFKRQYINNENPLQISAEVKIFGKADVVSSIEKLTFYGESILFDKNESLIVIQNLKKIESRGDSLQLSAKNCVSINTITCFINYCGVDNNFYKVHPTNNIKKIDLCSNVRE